MDVLNGLHYSLSDNLLPLRIREIVAQFLCWFPFWEMEQIVEKKKKWRSVSHCGWGGLIVQKQTFISKHFSCIISSHKTSWGNPDEKAELLLQQLSHAGEHNLLIGVCVQSRWKDSCYDDCPRLGLSMDEFIQCAVVQDLALSPFEWSNSVCLNAKHNTNQRFKYVAWKEKNWVIELWWI